MPCPASKSKRHDWYHPIVGDDEFECRRCGRVLPYLEAEGYRLRAILRARFNHYDRRDYERFTRALELAWQDWLLHLWRRRKPTRAA